jgi:hypothetical protein
VPAAPASAPPAAPPSPGRFELGVEPPARGLPARGPAAPADEWLNLDLAAEARAAEAPSRAPAAAPGAAPRVASLEDLDFSDPGLGTVAPAPEPLPAAFAGPRESPAVEAIDLPPVELEEEALELAPVHAFVPPATAVGHRPEPAVRPGAAPLGAGPTPGGAAAAGDGGEAQLRDALSRASREVIEKIAWEVIPVLAETIIREHLDRLVRERQGQ